MWISNKKMSLLGCLFFLITTLSAQQQNKSRWYGILQEGIVFDANKVNLQHGVAAGWQYKSYRAGLASGIDFIAVTSLQASIDLRGYIPAGNQRFFVYANPGLNIVIPSKNDREKIGWQVGIENKIKNGIYLEGGGGILLGKKKNLLAGLYWSRKTYKVLYNYVIWNPVTLQFEQGAGKNKYEYNRFGIKFGFVF